DGAPPFWRLASRHPATSCGWKPRSQPTGSRRSAPSIRNLAPLRPSHIRIMISPSRFCTEATPMKKALLTLVLCLSASAMYAADVVEAIVVRVGDRIITRSQYSKRLRDAYTEVEQTVPPDQVAAKKEDARKSLVDELVSELLIKDRADRLGISIA